MMMEIDRSFIKNIDAAIAKLVTAEHFRAGTLVSMPILYPSGASVVLELSMQKSTVFVSDRGGGYQEAEFLGATRHFQREADRVAQEFGIRFDGRDMFVAEVPLDRIDGAMAATASASAQAVVMTAMKAAERQERHAKEAMFAKLTSAFGADGFARDIELIGASNHRWRVDAMVERSGGRALFSSVTKSYISAAGTAAKFGDFARLEIPPRRVSVVSSIASLGDWYGVVANASDNIVELTADNDQYVKIGYAA